MHGEAVGIAVTPVVAVAYLIVAVFLFGSEPRSGECAERTAPHEGVPDPARGMIR